MFGMSLFCVHQMLDVMLVRHIMATLSKLRRKQSTNSLDITHQIALAYANMC